MAYEKKIWVDVENASTLTPEQLEELLPEKEDGTKQDALCRFDAANMNRIEKGLADVVLYAETLLYGDHNRESFNVPKIKTGFYYGSATYTSPGLYAGTVSIPCEKCPKIAIIKSYKAIAITIFLNDTTNSSFTVLNDETNSTGRVQSTYFDVAYADGQLTWNTTSQYGESQMNIAERRYAYTLLY